MLVRKDGSVGDSGVNGENDNQNKNKNSEADVSQNPLDQGKQLHMTENKSRLFDTSCSICMGDFAEDEPLMNTICKHSFHEECLRQWITKKISTIVSRI